MSLLVWLLVVQYEYSYDFFASFFKQPFFDGELQHFTTKMQIVLWSKNATHLFFAHPNNLLHNFFGHQI